jgi:hypothetical protein
MARRTLRIKNPQGYDRTEVWDYGDQTPKSWDKTPTPTPGPRLPIVFPKDNALPVDSGWGDLWDATHAASGPINTQTPASGDSGDLWDYARRARETDIPRGGEPMGPPAAPSVIDRLRGMSTGPWQLASGMVDIANNSIANAPQQQQMDGSMQPITQQSQAGGQSPSWADPQWWQEFTAAAHPLGTGTVQGATPSDYYGSPGQALADKEWGDQFYRLYGRVPTDDDWRWHWYGRSGGAGVQSNTPQQQAAMFPSGPSQPYAGPGQVLR